MTMHVEAPAGEPIILMSRTFAAPRDMVWTALTDPKHVDKWYGGSEFRGKVRVMDVRPGGAWKHTMIFNDGKEIELDYVYVDVVRPERLVWKNAAAPTPGMLAVVNSVTLEAAGPKTKWQLESRFASIAERDLAMARGHAKVIEAGCETLDAVARELAASPSGAEAR